MDAVDSIAFLARSHARVEILRRLLEAGPATQRAVRDDLDIPRSTVARSLTALTEQHWVEQRDGDYRLTPVGRLVTEEFFELAATIRTTQDLATFLTWFPHESVDLDLEALRTADITLFTEGNPYAPGRTQTQFVASASTFRGALPAIDIEGATVAHDQLMAGALEAELIVSPEVEATIVTDEFASLFREPVETGRLHLLVAADPVSLYLGLADGASAQIGVQDDDGLPRGLLESSNPDVVEWVDDRYRSLRDTARPMSVRAFE